jgi:hypothetical protein
MHPMTDGRARVNRVHELDIVRTLRPLFGCLAGTEAVVVELRHDRPVALVEVVNDDGSTAAMFHVPLYDITKVVSQ